jgi:hypothetical protein
MHRSGTQEREYQLQAWDASLVERQQALEVIMNRFQARMAQDVTDAKRIRKELEEQAAALRKREIDVAAREKAVAEAEVALLKAAKSFEAQQVAVEYEVQAHCEAIDSLIDSIERTGGAPAGDDVDDSMEDEEKELHVFQGRRATSVPASDRSPPSANKVPTIAMMSLARGSGQRFDHNDSRTITPTRQLDGHDATPPSRSPQLYEGPVDPRLPSMVEEIPDDEETPKKPRGLRSSPQFHPMDPNDSGLGFLRPSPRGGHDFDDDDEEAEEGEEEEEDHHEWDEDDDDGREALQDQLDTAIHFLVSEGVVNEEELEAWLQNGASAQQIIALYHEQKARMRPDDDDTPRRYGRDPQDDFEYEDGDDDMMYDDEDANEDGGERHRSEASSAGVPITVDGQHSVLEDGDISPTRQGGDGGEHNDSLTSNRVRGGSASPRSGVTISEGGEGQPTPPAASVTKHSFNSFDDDSEEDDNEF